MDTLYDPEICPPFNTATAAVDSKVQYATDDQGCKHRLWLERTYVDTPNPRTIAFLMCNGSTASKRWNDATLRKTEWYTLKWGYERMIIVNGYSFAGRDFNDVKTAVTPNLPGNNIYILKAIDEAELTVAAWSQHMAYRKRHNDLLELLKNKDLHYLKLSLNGMPAHPIYLSSKLTPEPWLGRRYI